MPLDLAALVAPGHTAVLTVEVQNGVVGDAAIMPMLADAVAAAGTLERIAEVLRAARQAHVPVVHCTVGARPDRFGSNRNARLFAPSRKVGSPPHGFYDLHPTIGAQPEDVVLPRLHGLSPMTSTSLDAVLRNEGITTIVATGVSINVAVLGLAFEGVNRGYQVVLPRDATAGVDEQYVDTVYANTLSLIATVTTTAALVDVWSHGGTVRGDRSRGMDFAFTEEEEAFRADLRAFLDVELPEWWRGMFVDDERAMPFTREMCRMLAERGWLTLAWPVEHGGSAAGVWMQTILREEMWAREEPRGPQYMNLNYIGPLIMRFGTPEQRDRFLPPMARGEVIWTQGFSEPDAGSDLASLATRAEDHGDHFVVNGQKIWSSYADAPADWCLLLARTDAQAPKHQGISVLLVDLETPGITVRPIDTMAGPHEFNEIFFDDVVVPHDCLLGPQDGGWDLVRAGLTLERVGIARYARAGRIIELLVAHMNETGRAGDPAVRHQLADLRARFEAARLLSYRAISMQAAGEEPRAEASIARIHNTQLEQEVGHVGLELLGPVGQLRAGDASAALKGEIHRQWVRNIPTTIAAGTLEIQKNIVARGLGLPR